ncbi:hypothetical protein ACLOJK_039680 [Asimina triloba]
MDLLTSAYSTPSDDEEDEKISVSPRMKRQRNENSSIFFPPQLSNNRPREAPITGRYVSKRERALSAITVAPDSMLPSTVNTTPGFLRFFPPFTPSWPNFQYVGQISDSDLPRNVYLTLRDQSKDHASSRRIPDRLSIVLNSHTKAPSKGISLAAHLLASAGMDRNVYVWNVWSVGEKKARTFTFHNAAVKDVRWSEQGLSLLSCGYDCSSRLVDIEKATEIQVFKEDQTVGAVRFQPGNSNLFLSGGSKGILRLWDIRVGKWVQEYIRGLGPILDIEFSADAKRFISSSDVSKGNISENSIIVWDVQRQVPLSNQSDTQTAGDSGKAKGYCIATVADQIISPSYRVSWQDAYFVYDLNGITFSSVLTLDKYKRYEKHSVSGFPIKCNFSLDGEKLASGSSDGYLYFYSYRSSDLIRKIKAYEQPCIDVAFHPTLPNCPFLIIVLVVSGNRPVKGKSKSNSVLLRNGHLCGL